MSGGTFSARIDELAAHIGSGTLAAVVEFDQAYAHRQHEDLGFKHPRGGGAKYLERALLENIPEYMETISAIVITDPHKAMEAVVERLANKASANAPRRVGNLRTSDHATVLDNGEVVYDRPAFSPRLTPHEIEAINEATQNPKHYYGAWPPVIAYWRAGVVGER